MGLFDKFGKEKKKEQPPYLYDEPEIRELDSFINDQFGPFTHVLHEIVSPDIHLDVCLVPPSEEEPYYKLVTMGAGAYTMNLPEEWRDFRHAEYVIYLPADWNLSSSAEEDYWPVRTLKDTARLPVTCSTWLSYGHTLQADEEGTAYASNTRFNSVVLDVSRKGEEEIRLLMSSGKVINFYDLIPLYPEELEFKMAHDAETLFEKFAEKGIQYKVVDPVRRNAAE